MWCLVLEGVLADLQQLEISYDPALLIAEVQSFAALEDKECQTLTTLIPWLDEIYELKIITEQFTRLIRDEKDESGKFFIVVEFKVLNAKFNYVTGFPNPGLSGSIYVGNSGISRWYFNGIERFSNDCRKTKTKAITPTNHNRSRQRDEPITIPRNYL